MTDLRPTLVRLRDRIPVASGGLERLILYRERRRRRRRIGTIGIALILGVAATLVAVRAFAPHDRSMPAAPLPHGAISFVRGTILAGASIPDAEIYLMEPDGSDVRKLTDAASEGKVAAEPAWSPDGTRIAFVLSTPEHLGAYAGDGDIFVMNADGTGLIKLTDGLRDAHPAWSPEGDRIVFVRDQGNSLVVMNADGSGATEIRPHGQAFPPYQWPAWSPDGTRIAFQASPSAGVDTNGVYVTDVDGKETARVTPGSADGYPAWSPDGTTLAYAGSDGIYLHDMQNGTNHRLTICGKRENCGFDFEPSWAPDGSRIVFARQDYGGSSVQIFGVNADGTGVQQLTTGPAWNAEPIWQPVPVEGGGPSPSPSTSMPSQATPGVSNVALPDGLGASRVAIGEGAVWVLASTGETGSSVLVRIDPTTDQVLATTALEAEPGYVAAGGGAIWVGSPRPTKIQRIDAATNEVTAQIQLPGDGVSAIAADDQAVWVEVIQDRSDQGQQNLASLVRIDPRTDEVVATIALDGLSGHDDEIAIGAGAVWVAGVNLTGPSEERGADLLRIDPTTDTISAVLPVSAFSVGAGADVVWVTSPADGVNDSLHKPESWVARKIDPTTNDISAPIPLPGNVSGVLAVSADGIWFSGYDEHGLIHPVRLQDGAFDTSVPPIESLYTDVAFDDASGTIWVAAISGLKRIDIR
jgi:dipeptidyl aminopeptidase/acylaminoacyl peptidase